MSRDARVEAHAVVRHREGHDVGGSRQAHSDPLGASVFGRIPEGFLNDSEQRSAARATDRVRLSSASHATGMPMLSLNCSQ